jgi:hypothetical protein
MRAVFKDNDDQWAYVMGDTEYDLGWYWPGKYIRANRNGRDDQLCAGGGFRGNTLIWPGGRVLSYQDAVDRLGRPYSKPEYEDLPDAQVLVWLAKALGATPYKSRAAYQRYYMPAYQRLLAEEARV